MRGRDTKWRLLVECEKKLIVIETKTQKNEKIKSTSRVQAKIINRKKSDKKETCWYKETSFYFARVFEHDFIA